MQDFVRFIDTNQAVEIFGTNLVGVNAENGGKVLVLPGVCCCRSSAGTIAPVFVELDTPQPSH